MKKTMILGAILISATAWASDSRPAVSTDKENGKVIITLTGPAALELYEALDAKPSGSFGIVQSQTKRTKHIVCVTAVMGDIPGQMSEPHYTCTITANAK